MYGCPATPPPPPRPLPPPPNVHAQVSAYNDDMYTHSDTHGIYTKVQKIYLLQQPQSLGESHPVPAQTLLAYKNCKRQSHRGA